MAGLTASSSFSSAADDEVLLLSSDSGLDHSDGNNRFTVSDDIWQADSSDSDVVSDDDVKFAVKQSNDTEKSPKAKRYYLRDLLPKPHYYMCHGKNS